MRRDCLDGIKIWPQRKGDSRCSVSFDLGSIRFSSQGLQILLMSGVSLTSALQILEAFWNIWSQVSDFPARGPGMYTLS